MRKAALVTGGANGIGAEYCRQLAALGMNLIILDRDETALEEIARELGGSDGVTTVAMDLAWPADRLLVELREALLLHFAREEEGLFPFVGQHFPEAMSRIAAMEVLRARGRKAASGSTSSC